MEESEGVVEDGIHRPATTTTTSLGDGECDESSVVQEPKKKKQKKWRKEASKKRCDQVEGFAAGLGLIVKEHDDALDEQEQVQFYIAADAEQYGCCNESEEAAAAAGGGGGGKDLRIEIPHSLPLSEVVETTTTTTTENEDEDDEDDDDGEGDVIPEFDPDDKGHSLFTEELRAAVEEGSALQLPPMMAVMDSHFPSDEERHQQQLLLMDGSKDVVHLNGGGLQLPLPLPPLTTVAPSTNTAYEGLNEHLDVIAFKIYSALQPANSHPPAVTSQAGEGEGHYQQLVDQEQGGDKNHAAGGIDEGERTPRHPRWTREETAVLLAGKRKRDEEIRSQQSGSKFALSATERWDSISNYCKAHGVDRDAHQCRKRWSNLAADFKKIRTWHKMSGVESYWSMRGDSRRKNKLPGSFDPEVYADMEATCDSNPHRKRKLVPMAGTAEDVDDHQHDPLASVLESSGRAMQAALARNIQAQIEAHNQNSELDRNQRKEQGDNLVGVLGLLADSLAKIAAKM